MLDIGLEDHDGWKNLEMTSPLPQVADGHPVTPLIGVTHSGTLPLSSESSYESWGARQRKRRSPGNREVEGKVKLVQRKVKKSQDAKGKYIISCQSHRGQKYRGNRQQVNTFVPPRVYCALSIIMVSCLQNAFTPAKFKL